MGLSRVGGSATTIHQFQNWVRCIRARAANGSGPLKFISPAQSHAACFSEEDPFCLPLFRAPFFGFRIFYFLEFFPRDPLAASGCMFRTMSKRQSLSQWFQLCDTIFPVFLAAYN